MKLKENQKVFGRMNSVWNVAGINYFESKNHTCERYVLKPVKNYHGNFRSLCVTPSDIEKIIFTNERSENQVERFLSRDADEF